MKYFIDSVFLIISIAVLLLLIFMFFYADSHNLWPKGQWGENEGNHGPWRIFLLNFQLAHKTPVLIAQNMLIWIFKLQFAALLLLTGILISKRTLNHLLLWFLNIFFFCVLVARLYWLID